MLERKDVSKSCDVYSYGILLWAIITHKEPFTDVSYVFLPSKVLQGEVSYFYSQLSYVVRAHYSQPFSNIDHCWLEKSFMQHSFAFSSSANDGVGRADSIACSQYCPPYTEQDETLLSIDFPDAVCTLLLLFIFRH